MKKLIMVLLPLALIVNSCKKDNATATAKDYSLSVKNKDWGGTVSNAIGSQPYTVHFNADNTRQWAQLSAEYTGRWSIVKNNLAVNLTSSMVVFAANITDDYKLENISNS